jgi:hypothetical protein
MSLLLPIVQQRNQAGKLHVDPEKDRHRAKRRVKFFRDLRPKADRA